MKEMTLSSHEIPTGEPLGATVRKEMILLLIPKSFRLPRASATSEPHSNLVFSSIVCVAGGGGLSP